MKYSEIDLETWKRKEHYDLFSKFDNPFFSLTCKVDVTKAYHEGKKNKDLAARLIYGVVKTANDIEEFRMREKDGKVILLDKVNPSFTVLRADELFNFCFVRYHPLYIDFKSEFNAKIDSAKTRETMYDPDEKDIDVIYMTSTPWLNFDQIVHPFDKGPSDSIPRIAWGKCFEE